MCLLQNQWGRSVPSAQCTCGSSGELLQVLVQKPGPGQQGLAASAIKTVIKLLYLTWIYLNMRKKTKKTTTCLDTTNRCQRFLCCYYFSLKYIAAIMFNLIFIHELQCHKEGHCCSLTTKYLFILHSW